MDLPSELFNFRRIFYDMVKQIPEGRVTTYGALARALGDIKAARGVGQMLNQNPYPGVVPCHRVVRSDGTIGGFATGVEKKIKMLAAEGVKVENGSVSSFEEIFFGDFTSSKPLKAIRENQKQAAEYVVFEDEHGSFDVIGGVDVAYKGNTGYAALSLWKEGEMLRVHGAEREIHIPYVPTYLAYRELPPLLEVLKIADPKPDAIIVDGNGRLHPLQVGLASHLGVLGDIPTIGVAKSLLVGEQEFSVDRKDPLSPVIFDGDKVGYAFLSSNRAKNPIYISPGHRVSHRTALEVVKPFCRYKIPDPIRVSHREATKRRDKR